MSILEKHRDYSKEADQTANQGRAIQQKVDQSEAGRKPRGSQPMQAGAREYPVYFGQQHQAKPGQEANLEPAPMYDAPDYKGSEKLKGKVALITGGDSGIGRAVAVL